MATTMCGIAGFNIAPDHHLPTSSLVRRFLAGLAERGEDACGFAWRTQDGAVATVKHALPPHEFLRRVDVQLPSDVRTAIVHVRDHTKGRPSHEGNNHPIRHGAVCGVHNGIIQNDDELFAKFGRNRAVPGMSVDSEAIFMLLDAMGDREDVFPQLVGSYSAAFLDDRDRRGLYIVRGRGRPLFLGRADGIVMFASTTHALEFASEEIGIRLAIEPVQCARLMRVEHGEVVDERAIRVRRFTEQPTVSYDATHPNAKRARALVQDEDDELQGARTA